MDPLERILSRQLMSGRLPSAAARAAATKATGSSSSSSSSTGTLSPIPSLNVPMVKSPHQRAAERDKNSGNSSNKNKPPQQQHRSAAASADIAAFAGLSTPHFEEDPRVKISERPERGGLRSLQDLPQLLRSACVLGEWETALLALREAFHLANDDLTAAAGQVSSKRNITQHHQQQLRHLIPAEQLATVAACVREQTGSVAAFEDFLDSVLLEAEGKSRQLRRGGDTVTDDSIDNTTTATKHAIAQQWTELGTEALVGSGAWIAALKRYHLLCAEGRGSVGSLNACITGLATGKQWEAALKLAQPAIEARVTQQLEAVAAAASSDSSSDGEKNSNDDKDVDEHFEPLSHRGSSHSAQQQHHHQQQHDADGVSIVAADGVTYASLVTTLETCGRTAEAQAVLKGAPQAERDAVMASYVALLSVWGEGHAKKLKKRF